MDESYIWIADVGLPTGIGKVINPHVALETANMGYMATSIWAADVGIDLDEEIDGVNMGSLRTISESIDEY